MAHLFKIADLSMAMLNNQMVTNKNGDLDGFLMPELTFFGISESVICHDI